MAALRSFLISVLPPGTPVVRGQINRVAESSAGDFVVFWPLRQSRLATNIVTVADNIIVGSISGTALTVTAIPQAESPLAAGMLLTDGTAGRVAGSTTIVSQLSGSVGGTGVYLVAPGQTLAAETLYAGQRSDLVPARWTIQCDVHGPASGDNVRIIEGLFRSELGVDAIGTQVTPQYTIVPLYANEARFMPFVNDQQQVEFRWTLDLELEIDPIIGTQQQFADKLKATLFEIDAAYPP
jgi:hypothetical protein